jgi:hypothetical protein
MSGKTMSHLLAILNSKAADQATYPFSTASPLWKERSADVVCRGRKGGTGNVDMPLRRAGSQPVRRHKLLFSAASLEASCKNFHITEIAQASALGEYRKRNQ